MRLYYSPGACSLAAHVALEEIGAPYEAEVVRLLEGENFKAPFLAINPRGKLPLLDTGDGRYLRETGAILIYLALRFPEAKLLPSLGSYECGRCLEWLNWVSTTHHNNLMIYWRPHRFAPQDADLQSISELAKLNFLKGSEEIERELAGPWFLGDQYTIVDPYLLFCFRQGNRIGLPMAQEFPRFTAWADRMIGRPAVKRIVEREGINLDGDAEKMPYVAPDVAH